MAFNLKELKEERQNLLNMYTNSLQEYVDSEQFEDALQNFLSRNIKNGNVGAVITLLIAKRNANDMSIVLMSDDNSIKFEVANSTMEARIGDIERYISVVEKKLKNLKLEFATNCNSIKFNKMKDNSSNHCDFIINLDI